MVKYMRCPEVCSITAGMQTGVGKMCCNRPGAELARPSQGHATGSATEGQVQMTINLHCELVQDCR